jgi:uncharacterized membrane protein YphA (DoxX/SURF4 family)
MIPQLQRETPISTSTESAPQWSLATRIGFRFVFIYFFLYIGPGAVGALGVDEKPTGYRALFAALYRHIVPWFGANILGVKQNLSEIPNGSGDQLYDYVLILCIVLLACLGTVLWSLLDRKRRDYQQLYQWLRLGMRLLMVTALMTYGTAKIIPMQFADIPLARYVDPLGHTSPQGLLWVFMGYSKAYAFFGGFAEMLGGLLLAIPRFTTLGALVSLGALSNVLMLNLCYDVPRKIFTAHLVLIAIFLVLPDIKRMVDFFIVNRATAPAAIVPFLKDRQINRGVLVLQYIYCAAILVIVIQVSYQGAARNQSHIDSSLRGIWYVERFISDNVELPPLVTNEQRWLYVVFDSSEIATIQPMEGTLQLSKLTLSPDRKALELINIDNREWQAKLSLENPEKDKITMAGLANGHPVSVTLRRVDLSSPTKFLLLNRGFHWITPVPRWR